MLLERGARYAVGQKLVVARLREHHLKLRDALARRARLDVCRDGIEALGHQAQSLLLRSGRVVGLSCGLWAACKGDPCRHRGVPPLLRASAKAGVWARVRATARVGRAMGRTSPEGDPEGGP